MTTNSRRSLLIASAIGFSMLTACGDTDDKEGAGVDHSTVQQAISENTTDLAGRFAHGLAYLEDSKAIQQAVDGFGETSCVGSPTPEDGSGADFDSGDCVSEPFSLETDEIDEAGAELADLLSTKVFVDANLETETSKSVTYLLRGSVVCDGGDSGEVDAECVSDVDDAEIRLYVTSPGAGDLDIAIQVGPQRDVPLVLELNETSVAADLDLSAVKGAVKHLGLIGGDMPELPDVMRGIIRLELNAGSANELSASLQVVDTIEVANDDYMLSVAAPTTALLLIANSSDRTLGAAVDLGEVLANFPESSYSYDELTDVESEVIHDWAIALAGASAIGLLEVDTDKVTLANVGLGDTTSTLGVNGAQVLAIDLNADAGRRFSADATIGHEMMDIVISPEFDLKATMSFKSAVGAFDSIEDFMLDDVLTITLDGDTPTLHMDEDGIEVVSGELHVAMQNEGSSVTVTAGQCLVEAEGTSEELLGDMSAGVCPNDGPSSSEGGI